MRATLPKRSLLPLLLLASGTLGAANYPDRYPEPKVIYQDPELIEKTGPLTPVEASREEGASRKDERYPAAYTTPKVIYQNPELIEKTGPLIPLEEKPLAPAPAVKAAPPERATAPSETREEARAKRRPLETEKATPPVGLLLIVIALAAFLFWWSRPQAASSTSEPSPEANAPEGEAAPEESAEEMGEAGGREGN